MSVVPPELQSKIASWRQRASTGDLTQEEMKEAIIWLRAGRLEAAKASQASRTKRAKAEIPNASDLLGEMEDL